MSSDSELEEFVDALDNSPGVSSASPPPRVESPVDQTEDVEEEERRILKLQKKAEERRRKEDEEIKKRLEKVQKKKEEDRLQQIEEERWKEAEMTRRRKLEQMRLRMLEDTTPSKGHGSSSEEDDPRWEDGSEEVTGQRDDTEKCVVTPNYDETPTAGRETQDSVEVSYAHHSVPQVDSLVLVKSTNTSENMFRTIECEEMSAQASVQDGNMNETQNPDCNDYHAHSSSHGQQGDNSVFIDSSFIPEEPDIVKSAKPRQVTVPQILLPPVAPPRRRKKRDDASTSSEYSSEDRSSLQAELHSPGLPPALPTPTSTVESLTRELEHSLDIQSAIGGGRHINAQDAEIGAVNSDHSSPVSEPTQTPNTAEAIDLVTPDPKVPPTQPSENKEKRTPVKDSPTEEADPLGRPRSNSGRLLTDEEILEMVMVVNLDTGEKVPLNLAEDALPKCVNPLSLHIMRRTKEYRSDSSLHKAQLLTDEEDNKSDSERTFSSLETSAKRKATKFKKFLGKTMVKTVSRVKSVADHSKKVLQGDDVEEEVSVDGKRFKFKACSHNKGPYDFQQFRILQDLGGEHTGAVWTMKFSPCGRLLATGGQDNILRIWILKSAWGYFEDLRHKYADVKVSPSPSPAPSEESLNYLLTSDTGSIGDSSSTQGAVGGSSDEERSHHLPFLQKPFCTYRGHTADLLDVSWSKNYFILSSSMDKTVRLWHLSRRECLCTFQHIDFVTAIVFHPRDDRYFLSGSLDGKLRLWNIPDKKVTLWNEVTGPSNLITTANFCQNGKFAVVGTYDGKCIFYSTDQLKYYTQIHVRSTRGKNARGRKITGIEPMVGEDRILVTSNDSRVRLYDLRDLTLTCKYKGCTNNSSQIKSSFSPQSKYIISGSEDHFVYIWKTHHQLYKLSSARRDRNDFWEAIKVHNAVVTAAIFAPNPTLFLKPKVEGPKTETQESSQQGEIIVSVDFTGMIKVIQNKLPANLT